MSGSAPTTAALDDLLLTGASVVAVGPGVSYTAPEDTSGEAEHTETADWYEQAFEIANAGGMPVYGIWPPLTQAAHERKMAIIDALPFGDLSDSVIVDYGVGDRGFAGAAPKLRGCKLAIGIDISAHAARESARISDEGDEAYGDRWAYLVARGAGIDVVDGAADFVFAGEVIEHVDHTEEWLDEVHRVLAPGGHVLITTPNAGAALYKARGEEWCVSAEHVALMTWDELRTRLEPRFEIVAAKGFNMSFHESLDADVTDPEVAKAWAANFEDRPDLANGMVVLARRREDWIRPRHEVTHLHHDDERLRYHGAWDRATLERNLSGRLGLPGAMMACDFEGTEVIVQFWCHHFSGIAEVEVDGAVQEVDLFSPHSGFRRVVVEGLPDGPHQLRVRAADRRNERSHDTQVVLHHVITGRTTA